MQRQQHRIAAIGPCGQHQPPHLITEFGEGLQRQLQQRALAQLHGHCRQAPVGLVDGDAAMPQRVIHAHGRRLGWSTGAIAQQQLGGELFGSASRIPLDSKGIELQFQPGVALGVEQFQRAAGSQEALQPLAAKGTHHSADHEHDQAGMHQQGPHPADHAAAGGQPVLLTPHRPALLL